MTREALLAQEIELTKKLEVVREEMRENYDMDYVDPYWQGLLEEEDELLIELGQVRLAILKER